MANEILDKILLVQSSVEFLSGELNKAITAIKLSETLEQTEMLQRRVEMLLGKLQIEKKYLDKLEEENEKNEE
jgi:hypothetical protein